MFNLKNTKHAHTEIQEKRMRNENLGPKADDTQKITESELDHKDDKWNTPIEDHLQSKRSSNDGHEVIEKVLEEATGYLKQHRAEDGVSVPPINTEVANEEKKRAKAMKTEKKSHWSQTFNEKKQQGSLPKFKKNAPQHDKIVVNNDRDRFGKDVKPLVGGITTADVDRAVYNIKTGGSAEYDIAITAILKEADKEKRELTPVEQQTITDLKIARTRAMMKVS